jgi:hypothetical protein
MLEQHRISFMSDTSFFLALVFTCTGHIEGAMFIITASDICEDSVFLWGIRATQCIIADLAARLLPAAGLAHGVPELRSIQLGSEDVINQLL